MSDESGAAAPQTHHGPVPGTRQARNGALARAAKAKPGEMADMQRRSVEAFNRHYLPSARALLGKFGGEETVKRYGKDHMREIGAKSPEEMAAVIAAAQAAVQARPPEWRAERARTAGLASAAASAEERSARARRAWETRRQKATGSPPAR